MKKDEMAKKVAEQVNSPPEEGKVAGRTRKIFSRTRRAARKRWRTSVWGFRNFALDARAISI